MTDNSQDTSPHADVRTSNARAFARAFGTSDGNLVLHLLHTKFDDGLRWDDNPQVLARNHGRREVVRYIMEQLTIAEQEPNQQYEAQGDNE